MENDLKELKAEVAELKLRLENTQVGLNALAFIVNAVINDDPTGIGNIGKFSTDLCVDLAESCKSFGVCDDYKMNYKHNG